MDKEKIYNEFYKRKYSGESGVGVKMADELGITKQRLYQILKEAQTGETESQRYFRLHRERLNIMWNEKYLPRFVKLPKNREVDTVQSKREIARDMILDGFPVPRTAELLQYADPTTLYKTLKVREDKNGKPYVDII